MGVYGIRQAQVEDAEQIIAHIFVLNREPDNGTSRGTGDEPTVEEECNQITSMAAADNCLYLVAVAPDETVVGMLLFHGGKRRSNRHSGVFGITVLKEWRDQGVGSALMREMISWAKGTGIIKRIELAVVAHNERAIHVYQKMGFVIEGRKRATLYKEGRYTDDYAMALILE